MTAIPTRLKVTSIRAIVPFKLVVSFSDGSSGTFDAAAMIGERGEGTEPLRERRFFGMVRIGQWRADSAEPFRYFAELAARGNGKARRVDFAFAGAAQALENNRESPVCRF
ncbi:DUF2442 domain-containing protein [Devosia sp. A8/3-2]|nr:DUF2442 domain-containing protein [Devosia sp. A8/3-2]